MSIINTYQVWLSASAAVKRVAALTSRRPRRRSLTSELTCPHSGCVVSTWRRARGGEEGVIVRLQ